MKEYVTLEIMDGQYDISCPDPACPSMVRNIPGNLYDISSAGCSEPEADGSSD